ncbi:uncharacterized protein UHOD_08871 [Ustilago sp. UG-2017b]|nr:uncharacterized protein UHOD_08871 [Ustilago sp. UG-2017b]
MSSADAADYGFKRFRVARACLVCRLRKTKCNGEQPCDRCKALSAECRYETVESPAPKPVSRTGSSSSVPNAGRASRVTGENSNNDDREDADSVDDAPADAAVEARAAKRQKRAMIDQIADRRWGDRQPSRSSSNRGKSGYVLHHLGLYASIDQDEPTEHHTELHTEDGISAHDQNTGNMQFYGFTSNFNFQHRLATNKAVTSNPNASNDDPSAVSDKSRRSSHLPESMKIWGHQDIIFRQSLSEKSFPTLDAAKDAVGDSTFLPPSIVDRFIENYMTLIQPQLGAVPKRQILKWVKDAKASGYISRGFSGVPSMAASGPGGPQPGQKAGMRTNELAALYVVLALGALMEEGDWEDIHAPPVPMTREGAIACTTTLFLLAKKRLEEIVVGTSSGSTHRGASAGIAESEARGERSSTADLSVFSLLGPTPTTTTNSYRAPSTNPALTPATTADGVHSESNGRDEWMQYYLSNFDWLTPLNQTPLPTNSHVGTNGMSPPDQHGGRILPVHLSGVERAAGMGSPGMSSPGSASGPASLSELDIGLLMGGVSVMEGANNPSHASNGGGPMEGSTGSNTGAFQN